MAAMAYAAVVSLMNTMDQIKIHPLLSTYLDNDSIEPLREKVDFFVDFVEKYSDAESEEVLDIVRRIGDIARDTEELIELQANDRICPRSSTGSLIVTGLLKKIAQEMDCVMENAMKAKEESGFINPYSLLPPASSSAPPTTTENCSYAVAKEKTGFLPSSAATAPPATAKTTTMVGFDGYLEQLLDQLTRHHSGRQILPIVGMGGIGKTTLATNVYQNSLMLHHFDIRAWITVSQEFSARNIILQALSCLGRSTSNIDTDDELGEKLYKVLSGRRYLIVLDDIWSVEAWEKIKFFFPENNNRSRVVVTTRQQELVDYFGSSALAVDFLDDKNSWELFCEKAFAQQGCCPHPELEKIGKKIVKKCKGLPLAISVIGGLLGKSSKTQEYWEKIAEDGSLIPGSGEGNIKLLSILYLSYKHLPIWLKPCFLYFGLYPEDHEIEVPRLIRFWVAEGFIKSKTEQSLEEVAESYLKELLDRNLVLVGHLGLNKNLESCRIHDMVRELCIRMGDDENYFCVRRDTDGFFYPRESQERLPSLSDPLIVERQSTPMFNSRLLRVLLTRFIRLPNCFEHLSLRLVFFDDLWMVQFLESSVELLWGLQTLINRNGIKFDAPCGIWKMPQLRHIDIGSIYLPNPPSPICEDDVIVLQNLQTLKEVQNLVLSEEVCKRIPNIKELGITYDLRKIEDASRCNYHLQNLGCFNKLEVLSYHCITREYAAVLGQKLTFPISFKELKFPSSFKELKFPSSLKELSLDGCKLLWSDMSTMIAALPHLQILRLENDAVVGPEWNLVEEQFLRLKHLQIRSCCDLIKWSADSSNFPMLETLSLRLLIRLEEIPSGIGEIATLERIDVIECSESATMSAIKLMEEQESLGNQSLQLQLQFWQEIEANIWRGKLQQLGITCQNLQIHGGNG